MLFRVHNIQLISLKIKCFGVVNVTMSKIFAKSKCASYLYYFNPEMNSPAAYKLSNIIR